MCELINLSYCLSFCLIDCNYLFIDSNVLNNLLHSRLRFLLIWQKLIMYRLTNYSFINSLFPRNSRNIENELVKQVGKSVSNQLLLIHDLRLMITNHANDDLIRTEIILW